MSRTLTMAVTPNIDVQLLPGNRLEFIFESGVPANLRWYLYHRIVEKFLGNTVTETILTEVYSKVQEILQELVDNHQLYPRWTFGLAQWAYDNDAKYVG